MAVTLPKLHEQLIDTDQHRALQADGAPWVCALQRSVDRSRDDLELGLRTVHVLGVKRAMVARVPVWRVATTVAGLRKLSGQATYYIARRGFRLLRLALTASEHPGSYDSHAWVTPWLPRRDVIGKVLLFG